MTTLTLFTEMPSAPGTDDLLIVVRGHRPATQGSKRKGRAGQLIDDNVRLKPWREAVKTAAIEAWVCVYAEMRGQHDYSAGRRSPRLCCPPPFAGPIAVGITFTCRASQADTARARRGGMTWPSTKDSGDLDKLQRAAFDACSDAGVWEDDARVVDVHARKVHPGSGPDSLDAPGVVIRIRRLT
ncbi:RusA family crossover junction endodeoxyribonuclease [Actinacidiphila glaucinigra]|uniref:RusA family crossover junction endodeoxyribonuclease n=1 Tax=Actinacidiphila glaucinigra TaxID=235986 RepID=UPI0035D590E2